MPLPDSIDPSTIQWNGAAGEGQRKASREDRQDARAERGEDRADRSEDRQDRNTAHDNAVTDANQRLGNPQSLRKEFYALPEVKAYKVAAQQLSQALSTGDGAQADLALTYAFAKAMDPDSVVREAEQGMVTNSQPWFQAAVESAKKQFGMSGAGLYSPEARAAIRQQIIRAVASRNKIYNEQRKTFSELARRNEIDPFEVVGSHAGDAYRQQFRDYDARRRADGANLAPLSGSEHSPAGRDAAEPNVTDLFGAPPEGAQIAGEEIRGWRFSPTAAREITDYVRSPEATPEGYANLVADRAVTEGHVPPEQRDDYYRKSLDSATTYFENLGPELRAKIPESLDYSAIDKAAAADAGLIDSAAQAFKNLPESGAQLLQGLTALPVDTLASITKGERTGSVKGITDLTGDLFNLARGQEAGPTARAAWDMLKDRYGGADALKNTAITDPLGLLGDASLVLSGGGSAAARMGGTAGKVGETVAGVGRAIDPLALAAKTPISLYEKYLGSEGRFPTLLQTAKNLSSDMVALPSGVGGAAVREAVGAGYGRGKSGAPTAASEAFTDNLRSPGRHAADTVEAAQSALSNLRTQASNAYQAKMAEFGKGPEPIDLTQVQMSLERIKPPNYEVMFEAPHRPSSHLAWQQMKDTVDHYVAQAAQNPDLLLPMAVDNLKQDIFDVGSRIGGQYDRDANRIASTAYNSVKDLLVKHDPVYAEAMKGYEEAAREAQQLEQTFSLGSKRGRGVNIDAATRKLQSIMRDGANANYGQRAELGDRLAELDPNGEILPALAGQQMSSWRPRGLNTAVGLGLGGYGAMAAPYALASAPAFSPRVIGELSYGAGKAAGTTARALEPTAETAATALRGLWEKYNEHPTAALAMAQGGSRAEEIALRELLEKYGLVPPLAATIN